MLKKLFVLTISTLVISTLSGCYTHEKQAITPYMSVSGKTKLSLSGNFESNAKGIYHLNGNTDPKAKVWYNYKSGSRIIKNTLHANKDGQFQIVVKNSSPTQEYTDVEINVRLRDLESNSNVASIINNSANFKLRESKDEKKALTYSESKESAEKAQESSDYRAASNKSDNVTTVPHSSTRASNSRYKKISLDTFIANPESYDGKDIQTTGTVSYIQRKPSDNTMDYVVLNNSNSTAATVTEIEVESVHAHHITENTHIVVKGGGLTKTVKLNGQVLKSDIIVDSISKY